MNGITLHCGDCRDLLPTLAADSIDACVTDPPYELNFMGKGWDGTGVAFRPETWAAVYRVLKPGAHLIAFSGTRTYHRMVCAIEDAGFEVRDQIGWAFGSGFPKSHDISKAIDRAAGAEREVVGLKDNKGRAPGNIACIGLNVDPAGDPVTAPATDAAKEWEGWGTALKPAWEPIVVARKPLSEPTVAANVLKWGTGAINIDGTRIGTEVRHNESAASNEIYGQFKGEETSGRTAIGRWPANLIHDGSEEVVGAFPETTTNPGQGPYSEQSTVNCFGVFNNEGRTRANAGDSGSAARFFYSAKADGMDRLGSRHPTVKPVDLIQYLVRLVTPKSGTCLDPFAGTGTLGEACIREGMKAVLIEREEEYQEDIRRRMKLAMAGPDERARETAKAKNPNPDLGPLFERDWNAMWAKPYYA